MLTTAFLGVAHIHTPGFINMIKKRGDVRVKAVYDWDGERGQKRATELDAQFVDSVDAIVNDPEITSVIICSETARHRELIEKSAAAGKHIFAEKPLATTGEEAAAMRDAIANAGVIFQTGFFQRSNPAMRFIKQEVEAGNLGTITRMRHTNCHQGSLGGWFDTEWRWIADVNEAGGGGYADLGAHSLDIILWVMIPACGPVKNVCGALGTATKRYGDIDEYGAGILTFESGALAVMEASWVDPKLRAPVEIHGTRGEIIVNDGKVFYYSELVEGADGSEWTKLPDALPHAFELFWDKQLGKDVPLVTIEEATEESRVMHEIYKAAL